MRLVKVKEINWDVIIKSTLHKYPNVGKKLVYYLKLLIRLHGMFFLFHPTDLRLWQLQLCQL